MFELIRAGECSYYIDCPAKMGLYQASDSEVYLIDSGNDKDAGRKVRQILDRNGWKLLGILVTHSNADPSAVASTSEADGMPHIRTRDRGRVHAGYPVLEPAFLYGGFPPEAAEA